nr:NADH dehydrogenase subunit 5 [Goniodes ortygis]
MIYWSIQWFFPLLVAVVSWVIYLLKFPSELILLTYNLSINREVDYEMIMIWDSFTLLFLVTVGFVAFFVMMYTYNYFEEGQNLEKFVLIMMIFIISMLFLVMSGDLMWVMVGWDGLGLSSFCLIAFYQNWKSLNSAITTFMMNRFGDFLIISSLGMMFIMMSGVKSWMWSSSFIMSWMICIGAFTKSAQIPFSTWLPLAMAAPTPVSSLVHSSTLVTAGVFLLIRFNNLIDSVYFPMIYLIGLTTIMLAGISSLGENDLKKIIALSTLSHVGLMVMFVGIGSIISAQVHLLVHAMFKSVLFMVSGMIIHMGSNNQDVRNLYLIYPNFFLSSSFIISLLSMMGAPFMAGFFSKEVCLDMLLNSNNKLGVWMSFFLSVSFTCSYSIRMMTYLFTQIPQPPLSANLGGKENQSITFFVMSLFSSIISGVIFSTISGKELYSFSFFSLVGKGYLILFIFMGLIGGVIFGKYTVNFPFFIIKFMNSMCMIESTVKILQVKIFNFSFSSMFSYDVKGIGDFPFSKIWKDWLKFSTSLLFEFVSRPLSFYMFVAIIGVMFVLWM